MGTLETRCGQMVSPRIAVGTFQTGGEQIVKDIKVLSILYENLWEKQFANGMGNISP